MAEPAEWKPTDYAAKLIKFKAKQLVGNYEFTDADREDIEQELLLHLWRRWSHYNPDRHPDAFAKVVVTNKVRSLIKHQQAAKRGGGRRQCSLNDEVGADEDEGATERGDLVDQESALRRLGRTPRHFTDEADLAAAIEAFLSALPPKLRDLAEKFFYDLPTHVSDESGIPWGTLYDRIKKMRKTAKYCGLDEFV